VRTKGKADREQNALIERVRPRSTKPTDRSNCRKTRPPNSTNKPELKLYHQILPTNQNLTPYRTYVTCTRYIGFKTAWMNCDRCCRTHRTPNDVTGGRAMDACGCWQVRRFHSNGKRVMNPDVLRTTTGPGKPARTPQHPTNRMDRASPLYCVLPPSLSVPPTTTIFS
jgi:hypothetical protein